MPAITAIYDASVLYPAPLRDFLMQLALRDLFQAKWSEVIHDEWISALLKNRDDLTRDQLERTRRLMNVHVSEAVVTGFEVLIDDLKLPDPNDRHVLAAAIKGEANVIVTGNLKDFPRSALAPYGIRAQHPDDFICSLLTTNETEVVAAAREQRKSLKKPPKTVGEYLETLERQGLIRTVARLRNYVDVI